MATAHNIASHESLFRIGIAADLLSSATEIFVALALYRLLSGVNRGLATIMVVLGLMDVPIYFLNTLNDVGALLFAKGADVLSAFDITQRAAMTMLFVNLHHCGIAINDVFFGLWLFPLGMLVYKSRFLPRTLGVWLVLNCLAYLAQSATGILLPQYATLTENMTFLVQFGEVAFVLWLLIMGAKEKYVAAAAAA